MDNYTIMMLQNTRRLQYEVLIDDIKAKYIVHVQKLSVSQHSTSVSVDH